MAAAEASASRRGLARLRATGPAGIASAVVIAVATFAALFGPLLAPYDPEPAEPVAVLGRPGRRSSARV